jgi:hypothetical protein
MHERTNIQLSRADRSKLKAVVANRNSPQKHVWRAKIVLLTAAGRSTAEIEITSTARPVSRLTRARTSSINSNKPFQSPPLNIRRLIFAESGVMNPITQLCLLNSIAKKHRAVSTCIAAGRLLTVRTVIGLSYALVVGLHRNGITRPPLLHRISTIAFDSPREI